MKRKLLFLAAIAVLSNGVLNSQTLYVIEFEKRIKELESTKK